MMRKTSERRRVLIMGAAGRDFHNFNVVYRHDAAYEVVAFTAAQIPGIAERRYPSALAGSLYPDGIDVFPESELASLITRLQVDDVVFAYSDVAHEEVMHKASIALASGANFILLGANSTMLKASVPVISICAVRTGAGKSQVARWLSRRLGGHGLRVAVLRHPMPYGDLSQQTLQRFTSMADLDAAACTIEEREEYEPHLAAGRLVFAGVDYERILEAAQGQCDVIIWDGGNNDFSFIKPDLQIALVDPLRAGHETTHHPGEAVLRMADIVVVAKSNIAQRAAVQRVISSAQTIAPGATIVCGLSKLTIEQPDRIRGRRVIVIDDGPSLTHGGLPHGAGYVAAIEAGASQIIDPRASAVGSIAEAFACYPHLGKVLPALGYSPTQIADLQASIDGSGADVAVSGTPVDLSKLLSLRLPVVRVRYEYDDQEEPHLAALIDDFLSQQNMI